MEYKWNKDCRHFPGTMPCEILKENEYTSCEECGFYEPVKKVLIIKYGAAGDILRTTPILEAIIEKYGNAQIYWLVNERDKTLINDNPIIDFKLSFNFENIMRLKAIKFDVLFSLDLDKEICVVANYINAKEKFGFYLGEDDNPCCLNKSSEYYLEKVWSDKMNLDNRKTYQELLFEVCELEYKKQDYLFYLNEYEKKESEKLKGNNKKIIGISIGIGGRWKSKYLPKERVIELIEKINYEMPNEKIMLIGGIQESDLKKQIVEILAEKEIRILYIDKDKLTTEDHIISVNACDVVISGDSLSMHIALALKKKVIGLFFCTPDWEIEGYNRLTKISSPLIKQYFFTDQYLKELINSIKIEDIVAKLIGIII